MTTGSIWKMTVGMAAMIMLGTTGMADEKAAEDGLVLHWGFDEVQGQTVKDLSGKGNGGRLEGVSTIWLN